MYIWLHAKIKNLHSMVFDNSLYTLKCTLSNEQQQGMKKSIFQKHVSDLTIHCIHSQDDQQQQSILSMK